MSDAFIIGIGYLVCSYTIQYARKLFSFPSAAQFLLLASLLLALLMLVVRPIGEFVMTGGPTMPRNLRDVVEIMIAYAIFMAISLGLMRYLYRMDACPDESETKTVFSSFERKSKSFCSPEFFFSRISPQPVSARY